MTSESPEFLGLTPYLHYADLPSAIDWLTRVFGFAEKGRWIDGSGRTTNAELLAGSTELWLDGSPDWWTTRGRQPEEWIGVWVRDVDAMHERIVRSGVEAQPPVAKFYGVRVLQVTDPEGNTWGFLERAPYVARHPEGA